MYQRSTVSRRLFLSAVAAGAGLSRASRYLTSSTPDSDVLFNASDSLRHNLHQALNGKSIGGISRYSDVRIRDHSIKAIRELESRDIASISYSHDGTIRRDVKVIDPESLTIVRKDCQLMDPFYAAMSSDESNFAREHLEWVVCTPNSNGSGRDYMGFHLGGGIILLDTLADDGRARDFDIFPSLIAHEADHVSRGGPLLVREYYADLRGLSVRKHQLQHNKSEVLQAAYVAKQKEVDSGRFLMTLGPEFNDINPSTVITSRCLLQGYVRPNTLRRYIYLLADMDDRTPLERELYYAAFFAEKVDIWDLEKSARDLYQYATDPGFRGTLVQVNSALALGTILPRDLKEQSTVDYHTSKERFRLARFNPWEGLSGPARAIPITGHSVSGIPPLEKLLESIK